MWKGTSIQWNLITANTFCHSLGPLGFHCTYQSSGSADFFFYYIENYILYDSTWSSWQEKSYDHATGQIVGVAKFKTPTNWMSVRGYGLFKFVLNKCHYRHAMKRLWTCTLYPCTLCWSLIFLLSWNKRGCEDYRPYKQGCCMAWIFTL